jgi:hypothetical protein
LPEQLPGEESASATSGGAPVGEITPSEWLPEEQAPNQGAEPEESLHEASLEEVVLPADAAVARSDDAAQLRTQPLGVTPDHSLSSEGTVGRDGERSDAGADSIEAARTLAEENEWDLILEPAPRQDVLAAEAIGPDEDPGDLFEPWPVPLPGPPSAPPAAVAAPAPALSAVVVASDLQPAAEMPEVIVLSGEDVAASDYELGAAVTDATVAANREIPAAAELAAPNISMPPATPHKLPLQPPSPPPRAGAMASVRSMGRATASDSRDPLAAVRALSEEELIALFS